MDSPAWKSTLLGRLSFTKRERARRTGPLPSRKRLKASDMRKTGSCFLCHIHGEGCTLGEQRSCFKCLTRLSKLAPHLNLKCMTICLKDNSVYNTGSDSFPSLRHILKDTSVFMTLAERTALPLQKAIPMTIPSLAKDISQWVMGCGVGIPASKLNLLVSPAFQSLTKDYFGDILIKSFRLLTWATTLLNSVTAHPREPTHIEAQDSLTRLVNFHGKAVVTEVDRLCKYSNMKNHSPEQRMVLFLVLIGLCLAASYIRPGEESPEIPDECSRQLEIHIEGLAYVGTYIGHRCHLFNGNSFDAQALVTAAQKRWDQVSEYRWQIPPNLAKELTEELGSKTPTKSPATTRDPAVDTTLDFPVGQQQPMGDFYEQGPRTTSTPDALIVLDSNQDAALTLPIIDTGDSGKQNFFSQSPLTTH